MMLKSTMSIENADHFVEVPGRCSFQKFLNSIMVMATLPSLPERITRSANSFASISGEPLLSIAVIHGMVIRDISLFSIKLHASAGLTASHTLPVARIMNLSCGFRLTNSTSGTGKKGLNAVYIKEVVSSACVKCKKCWPYSKHMIWRNRK